MNHDTFPVSVLYIYPTGHLLSENSKNTLNSNVSMKVNAYENVSRNQKLRCASLKISISYCLAIVIFGVCFKTCLVFLLSVEKGSAGIGSLHRRSVQWRWSSSSRFSSAVRSFTHGSAIILHSTAFAKGCDSSAFFSTCCRLGFSAACNSSCAG